MRLEVCCRSWALFFFFESGLLGTNRLQTVSAVSNSGFQVLSFFNFCWIIQSCVFFWRFFTFLLEWRSTIVCRRLDLFWSYFLTSLFERLCGISMSTVKIGNCTWKSIFCSRKRLVSVCFCVCRRPYVLDFFILSADNRQLVAGMQLHQLVRQLRQFACLTVVLFIWSSIALTQSIKEFLFLHGIWLHHFMKFISTPRNRITRDLN